MPHPHRSLRRLLTLGTLVVATIPMPSASAAITGVCPDGSIFIVQQASAVPCRDAKRVDSNDVPPIQPEMLPRPYGWERFNQRTDPNNPYNMIETARPTPPRPAPRAAESPQPQRATRQAPAPERATPVAATRPAQAPVGLDLALSGRDKGELGEIVDLMQSVAPATFARHSAEGRRTIVLRIARSDAFEGRVHAALARRGVSERGPVVLFRTEALASEPFHGNLTFVQGHVAFHPDPSNPSQFGVLDGDLGEQGARDTVLGYAVLPPRVDPAKPLDIYWNDRQFTATLRP